mmetsp:Transcript_164949/g.529465  ORF Transcript_164949/g.529465 Transcript_164949/m.529465 type:complete len:263 (+) Transcript_164949:334-1122(+)
MAIPEHAAKVVVLLDLDVLQAAVHHVLLLELEQLNVSRSRREHHLEQQPRGQDHVLEVDEQHQLLGESPRVILVRCEYEQDDIRGGGHHTEDVEGRVPRLVRPGADGHGSLLAVHQGAHVQEYVDQGGRERGKADPRRGHREEGRKAVREQNLVEVLELVVDVLLRLLLRRRHVRELQGRAAAQRQVQRRAHGAPLHEEAAPPEGDLGLQDREHVRERHPEEHEHGELPGQVFEAIVLPALHGLSEEIGVVLEECSVVQDEV